MWCGEAKQAGSKFGGLPPRQGASGIAVEIHSDFSFSTLPLCFARAAPLHPAMRAALGTTTTARTTTGRSVTPCHAGIVAPARAPPSPLFGGRLTSAAAAPSPLSRPGASGTDAAPSSSTTPPTPPTLRLPISPGDQADQAAAAVLAAHAAGATRVRVDLLLPITGATDLDDWPGGVRMQAKAAMPLVERLLAAVRRGAPALGGRLDSRVLDDGDAVCEWANPALAAILFPTAETLSACVAAAEARDGIGGGLTMIINPQWNDGPGQLVPDFGFFGRAKKSAAAASFQLVYSLSQMRVSGDDTRLQFSLLSSPDAQEAGAASAGGAWTVWYTPDGSRNAAVPLTRSATRPSYREVEATLIKTPGTAAGLPPLQRAAREAAFIQRTMKDNVREE